MPDYHAHIYFDAHRPEETASARQLRSQLAERFHLQAGMLIPKPVGPHSKAMFQVTFRQDEFSRVVSWLMWNRRNHDVLVHGNTGNDLLDHTQHVLWLGKSLPLRLDRFANNT